MISGRTCWDFSVAFEQNLLPPKSTTSNATPWYLAPGQTEIWTLEGKFIAGLLLWRLALCSETGKSPSTGLEEPRTLGTRKMREEAGSPVWATMLHEATCFSSPAEFTTPYGYSAFSQMRFTCGERGLWRKAVNVATCPGLRVLRETRSLAPCLAFPHRGTGKLRAPGAEPQLLLTPDPTRPVQPVSVTGICRQAASCAQWLLTLN